MVLKSLVSASSTAERSIPMKRTRNIARLSFASILSVIVATLILNTAALGQIAPRWIPTGSLNTPRSGQQHCSPMVKCWLWEAGMATTSIVRNFMIQSQRNVERYIGASRRIWQCRRTMMGTGRQTLRCTAMGIGLFFVPQIAGDGSRLGNCPRHTSAG
jgi:hypothetical protein